MSNPTLDDQMEQLRQQLARLEKSKQDTAARFARIGDMRADIAAVEARVTSPGRVVTVVAGPGGSIKSMTFGEEARRCSPTQLSQAAMSTLRQAVAEAARKQAEVMQEHLGDQLDLLDRVRQAQQTAFTELGDTEAPQTPPRPVSRRPRPTAAEDEPEPIMREGW